LLKSVFSGLGAPLALALMLGAAPSLAVNPYVQIEQLEESRTLGNGRLAELLSSADRSLAIRVALAIGRTKQAAGLPLLQARAHDPDVAMRAMAVYGVGLIGGRAATRTVLDALYDSSDAVRIAALDATDRLETAHSFSREQEQKAQRGAAHLLQTGTTIVRARAATALQSFTGGPSATAAWAALRMKYLSEPEAFVRWHIMWSLFRGYAKETPQTFLAKALQDPDEIVRVEAVRALGRRGDAQGVALLKNMLADRSWRVQEQALESIAVLQGGKPTEHLKSIPSAVRTPAPVMDRFASVSALPRIAQSGKPQKPLAQEIIQQPKLDPLNATLITGPANGPHPRVRLVTTQGNIYIELYPEWAPLTVENFLNLSNRGYYDNNPWFRIVPDFVVQTGDPSGNGNGDAGYMIPAEENPIEQGEYVISMGLNYTDPPNAHAIRDSAGTQYYITLSPQLHLDRDFTVFGKVIAGFDVLGRLIETDKVVRVERLPDTE
jgi:peptidyl-prolyl cis-trans isomerase B (cyclophilin B)